jgi:ribonuclease P protein component
MISRINRFHGHGSLNYVYRNGKTVRGPLCSIRYTPNNRRENYRLSIVVSKKVNKSAVVRNRIRRRLYESFRLKSEQFNGVYDIVVTVFNDQLATIDTEDIKKLVHTQLKQAKII